MAEILIVDDDENICSAFRQLLEADGHHPVVVSNAADALEAVRKESLDLIFMDIRMPGVDGLEALKQIRTLDPDAYVVIMTAYSTSRTSIEAVRLGAFDYLIKPFGVDEVRRIVEKALLSRSLSRTAAPKDNPWDDYSLVNLVGTSPRMQEIYKLIGLVTTNDVPAFITGERGVGKQLVAQTIHFNSSRKEQRFITVNCQILAETLELEIFGRANGGATSGYIGAFGRADGGTLFLEEIRYLPLAVQNRLLRYLRDKTYEQSGGGESMVGDVRIIASSTDDPAYWLNAGFSEELYDALRVITIDLPPLRDRKDDIPQLVSHFVRRHNKELQKNVKGIDDRGIGLLRDHGWPGNVAELETVVKRACILSRGDVITVDDLQNAFDVAASPTMEKVQNALEAAAREALHHRLIDAPAGDSSIFHDIVNHVESVLVREALRITGGNQVQAADMLGLNRATLRKKIS